jgi:mRNA interferase RelE/StbE
MAWRVEFLPVAEKQFSKLDRPVQRRIAAFLVERIATDENPRRLGDALEGPLSGFWRYRIGEYRLLCRIEDDRVVVVVVQIAHRSKAYRRR